jgi:cytochrome bd-type quinol oxidase subunit 2
MYVMPVVSVAALFGTAWYARAGRALLAFAASSLFLAALLGEAAATLFPYLLPSFPAGHGGISIYDAAPGPVGLTVALVATIGGIAGVIAYGTFVWRRMAAKIRVE